MAKAETTETQDSVGTLPDSTAQEAPMGDAGGSEGILAPTPSGGRQTDTQTLAENPAISEAYDRVFGGAGRKAGKTATAEAPKGATRRKAAIQTEEEVDELDGLKGSEADDGVDAEGTEGLDRDQADADRHAAEDEPERRTKEQEGADEASTLSPILRHAAKRAGWEDGDIDELAKANPAMAEKTFSKLLRSFNDLSAEYGRLGAAPAVTAQPIAAPQATPRPDDLLSSLYGPDKITKIRETFGPDFVEEVLQPLVAPVQELMHRARQQEMEVNAREIGEFFGGLPKEFSDLYGSGNKVSEAQMEARFTLGRMADQQRRGAASVGVHLSVKEALDNANLQFAAQHLSEIERKRITGQVKKRSSQITQRPSQRSRYSAAGEPSIEAAQEAYAKRAAELGLDIND